MSPPIGPLVRLWGMPTAQLPAPAATADELAPFLTSILREALPFIDSAAPRNDGPTNNSLWKRLNTKTCPASTTCAGTRVELSQRVIPATELAQAAEDRATLLPTSSPSSNNGPLTNTHPHPKFTAETWACRRSVHADAAARGTASWAEFERWFRDEHAAAEAAFTPAAVAHHEAIVWAGTGGVSVEDEQEEEGDVARRVWSRFTLKMVEMRHRIGRPVLKDRTFPVLQMTAAAQVTGGGDGGAVGASDEFVVVSIPVPNFGVSEHSRLAREKGAQVARYVSVERFRKLPVGEDGGGGQIEWLMATAGDAGGVLPMWVQNMATPGLIWKDVLLFLDWIARERDKSDVVKPGPPDEAKDAAKAVGDSNDASAVPSGA